MVKDIFVVFVSMFFISSGILFMFWAVEFRDWILKWHNKPVMWQNLMFERSYIFSFRFGGFFSFVVGCLLIWIYFLHRS